MTRLEYSPFSQHFLRARPLLSWCPSQQEPKISARRYNITLRRSSYKYYRGRHVTSVRSVALKLMILFQISRVQTCEGRHGAPRPWLRYRAGRSCCSLCGWDRPCCSQLLGAAHWLSLSFGLSFSSLPPLILLVLCSKKQGTLQRMRLGHIRNTGSLSAEERPWAALSCFVFCRQKHIVLSRFR